MYFQPIFVAPMFMSDIVINNSVFIIYNDVVCNLCMFRDYVKAYFHYIWQLKLVNQHLLIN